MLCPLLETIGQKTVGESGKKFLYEWETNVTNL